MIKRKIIITIILKRRHFKVRGVVEKGIKEIKKKKNVIE